MTLSSYTLFNCRHGFKEVQTLSFHVDCLVDGIGTMLLVFYGVFATLTFDPMDNSSRVATGALIGGVVYCILETFGPIQWAAINPVIAMAFVLTGKISVLKGIFYIIFELLGGVAGAYTAWQLGTSVSQERFGPPSLGPEVTWAQAFVATGMITFSLTLITIASLDDDNRKPSIPGLAVGVTAAYGIIIASPHSAGIANPAVAFALAVLTETWDYQGLFWASGFTGGLLATILFKLVIKYGGQQKRAYDRRNDPKSLPVTSSNSVHPLTHNNVVGSSVAQEVQPEILSHRF